MITSLTDEEKNNLVLKNKGIIIYMANKYRSLDEFEELEAWCNLGFSKAINKHKIDSSINFASTAFREIKSTIIQHYYRSRKESKCKTSLNEPLFTSPDGSEFTLEDSVSEDIFRFNENDIIDMLGQSLFEEQGVEKNITIDYLMQGKTIQKLSRENDMTALQIRRIVRRGIDLIKIYLSNNDIISDFLLYPTEEKQIKNREYKKVTKNDCEKIKYIRRGYPGISINDIAILTGVESYVIQNLIDFPTGVYLRSMPDNSIKEKVEQYYSEKFPERVPGEVIIINPAKELQETV